MRDGGNEPRVALSLHPNLIKHLTCVYQSGTQLKNQAGLLWVLILLRTFDGFPQDVLVSNSMSGFRKELDTIRENMFIRNKHSSQRCNLRLRVSIKT